MNRTVVLAGKSVSYVLTYKQVKNINLRVHHDGTIAVSAPPTVSVAAIDALLHQREKRIATILAGVQQREALAPRVRQYVEGEIWYYLGEQKTLHIEKGTQNRVLLEGSCLNMTVIQPADGALREKTLNEWFSQRCMDTAKSMCQTVYPRFQPLGVPYPKLQVHAMTSRWGVCRPREQTICLSRQLVEAPLACFEEVVCHEFTHFLHMDHSKAFYQRLAAAYPGWKATHTMLNSYSYRQTGGLLMTEEAKERGQSFQYESKK